MKQTATEIAAANRSVFIPSDGWLGRWKLRHSIIYKQEQGEKQDANVQRAEEWKSIIIPTIMEDFTKEDIINADETGLYFRCFPDKGYSIRGYDLPGGKKAKDRFTVMLCANMSSSEKIPLLVIVKSKRPRSFPKDLSKLPVQYQTSKNARMTGYTFEQWLKNWDNTLRSKKRKICLLVDNCSANSKTVSLTNIVLNFLPSNTTIVMQPMDMGVIKNWKAHYKSRLNSRIINAMDSDLSLRACDIAKSISLSDALKISKLSWDAVEGKTIAKCFQKGGFLEVDLMSSSQDDASNDDDMLDDVSLPSNMSLEEFENFIDIVG